MREYSSSSNKSTPVNPWLAILAGWLLIFALVAPAPASASPANESDFVARVNATRASVGLAPLTVDSQLTSLARGWANRMRDGVCGEGVNICHAGSLSSGVSHNWTKLGENVGTGPSVAAVMPAFIASPGHYANIVDPSFTHIGVGVVWDGNRMYTTHRFMALSTPPPPPTTAAPTTTTTAAPATTTTAAPTTTTTAPQTTTAPAVTPAAPQSPDATRNNVLPAPSANEAPRDQSPTISSGDAGSSSEPETQQSNQPTSTVAVEDNRARRADILVSALTRIDAARFVR